MPVSIPNLPEFRPDGEPPRSIVEVLLERRATAHFEPVPVPERFLEAILRLGGQAPSGYNLQPWRFIVVRDRASKERLRKVAYDQAKVTEAPVVLIAVGMKQEIEARADEILREGVERGVGTDPAKSKRAAFDFLSKMDMAVWINRHVMIALTTMMLVAEAYGFDTAPMEGFDPEGVKREFGIPDEAQVVALLAIGRAKSPDKAYPGRLRIEQIACVERWGEPWPTREPEVARV